MSNAQKTPLSRTLNRFAAQKALDEISKRGQGLPGFVKSVAGSIVTIDFQVSDLTLQPVEMPVFGPEYIRYPIQRGDMGVALPASVYIGGVTGLGGGIADTTLRGNLSTLIWFPVGNTDFFDVDPNAVVIYGPNGVVLQDTDGDSVLTLTPSSIQLDTSSTFATENLGAGNGATGTFTDMTGQVVTVQDGIITNIE